jgi:hypothetical protein
MLNGGTKKHCLIKALGYLHCWEFWGVYQGDEMRSRCSNLNMAVYIFHSIRGYFTCQGASGLLSCHINSCHINGRGGPVYLYRKHIVVIMRLQDISSLPLFWDHVVFYRSAYLLSSLLFSSLPGPSPLSMQQWAMEAHLDILLPVLLLRTAHAGRSPPDIIFTCKRSISRFVLPLFPNPHPALRFPQLLL